MKHGVIASLNNLLENSRVNASELCTVAELMLEKEMMEYRYRFETILESVDIRKTGPGLFTVSLMYKETPHPIYIQEILEGNPLTKYFKERESVLLVGTLKTKYIIYTNVETEELAELLLTMIGIYE